MIFAYKENSIQKLNSRMQKSASVTSENLILVIS